VGTPNGKPAVPVEQLGLFGAPPPHPVVTALQQVDADQLTPLAALQLVASLAAQARGEPVARS
jgi:hypothetical protein